MNFFFSLVSKDKNELMSPFSVLLNYQQANAGNSNLVTLQDDFT